jgi:acetylornithine deacetylase/succinyl-diaminopimelate desuccinylase-like protein
VDLDRGSLEAMADVLRAARGLELPVHPQLGQAILVPTDVISRPFPALSVLPDRCTALDAIGAEPGVWVFCTNGSGTAGLGIATIGYGPGDETLAHRVDEHIELDELYAGARGSSTLATALTA